MPLWWNWQTRGTQNPVVAIPCRFDPDQRHHNKKRQVSPVFFCYGADCEGTYAATCLPSFVNLPANSCRRFPFTGYGNPRRVPTSITQYLDTMVTATSPNRFLPVFFCYGTDCEGTYAATRLPSLINLLANFCRGFPFTGFGNHMWLPTNVTLYSDITTTNI